MATTTNGSVEVPDNQFNNLEEVTYQLKRHHEIVTSLMSSILFLLERRNNYNKTTYAQVDLPGHFIQSA